MSLIIKYIKHIKLSYHLFWGREVFFLDEVWQTESCNMDDFVSDLAAFRLRYPMDDDAPWHTFEGWHPSASFDSLLVWNLSLKAYNYILNSTEEVPRLRLLSQHNAMTEKRYKLQLKCILMKHMIPYDISKTHVRMRRYEHILRGAGLGSVVSMLDKKPVELRLLLHKFGCTACENWALPAVCSRTWLCQI